MIKSIYLQNFLLIEQQTINFHQATNAIFGETGSGKSILFKAFMQLSGQKADQTLIRQNCDHYLLEAKFNNSKQISKLLMENEIDELDELIISRKTAAKSVIRINGEVVTLKVLQQFGQVLFDFTNQHEVTEFTNSNYILQLVSDKVNLQSYLQLYNKYIELNKQLEKINDLKLNKDEQLEIVNYRLKQLTKIDFFTSIEMYHQYLEQFEALKDLKSNSENYKELLSTLSNSLKQLNNVSSIVSKLETDDDLEALVTLTDQLNDLDFTLNKKYNVSFDEREYEEMSNNINTFKTLLRTYKMDEQQLIDYRTKLKLEIEQLEAVDVDYNNVLKKLTQVKSELDIEATKVNELRISNAKSLQSKIIKLLSDLQMSHVNVEFEFTKVDYNSNGFDKVELLVSTNNQNTLQPINKIASGGELSRILLAIKSVSDLKNDSTLFFDEIDSGVSGKIAALMSKILVKLSKNTQIVYISHLPQMLCVANNFLYVNKTVEEHNAVTEITSLQNDLLIDKLAYFIDNEKPTAESKALITKMLKEVNNENLSN